MSLCCSALIGHRLIADVPQADAREASQRASHQLISTSSDTAHCMHLLLYFIDW